VKHVLFGATVIAFLSVLLLLTGCLNPTGTDSPEPADETPIEYTVSIEATTAAASEDGPSAGQITVTRGEATTGDLAVSISLSGTASSADYSETITSPVTIPDGDASVSMTVTPVDDSEREAVETLVVTVSESDAYQRSEQQEAAVSITSNDFLDALVYADDLTDTDSTGTDETGFAGPYSIVGFTVDGNAYAAVSGYDESGVEILSVGSDGSYSPVDTVIDDGTTTIAGPGYTDVVTVGGNVFLVVPGYDEHGFTVFQVATDGTLSVTDNVADSDDAAYNLQWVWAAKAVTAGASTYIVLGGYEDGVSVFELSSDGTVTNTDNVSHDGTTAMENIWQIETFVTDTASYVVPVGLTSNGFTIFELASDGTLTNRGKVVDDETILLEQPYWVRHVAIDGDHYLYSGGASEHGISSFLVANDGTTSHVTNYDDDETMGLFETIDGVVIEDVSGTVLVTASWTEGVSLFEIGANGALTVKDTIAESDTTAFDYAYAISSVAIGTSILALTAAYYGEGIASVTVE